jgi:hypothetical protein
VLAKRDDALDTGVARAALEPHELRVIAVDHRRTAALEPEKDFRLGVGDCLERAEEFEVHRLDRGDDRDLRPHQASEWLDLAGMIHAYFEHCVVRALRTARERERHAPVIVVGSDRSMGFAAPGKRQAQRLLCAGLADRAGDGNDFRLGAPARRPRQIA